MKKYCLECGKDKSHKGLYCKSCGYKHRLRPSGLKYTLHKVNPTSFKSGHIPWSVGTKGIIKAWNKNKKYSDEEKNKLNLTGLILGRGWNKGLPYMQDENHPNWKGDNVGYSGIHTWVKRKLGNPNKCSKCGTTQAKRFDWDNISGLYKRDLSDWQRLCSMCHCHKHKNWEARWHTA